jgi:thiamine-monophosphate kinase
VDIKELGESGLVRRIADTYRTTHPSIIAGMGDDAAALQLTGHLILLATCDLLLEDVHFDLSLTDPFHLGKKSLAVNLSDIAAMGGTPRFFLVSLGLPRHLPLQFIDDFYRGMMSVAQQFHTILVGGDTNASPRTLVIDITVMGEIPPDQLIQRGGARSGDSIWITGTVGDAALGFTLLRKAPHLGRSHVLNPLIEKHLSPCPRVHEGRLLAENRLATAMIDISDGLLTDLSRILSASGRGATVRLSSLPLSPAFMEHQSSEGTRSIDYALSGGEDYELLFTTAEHREQELLRVAEEFAVPITRIGEITTSHGLQLLDDEGRPYEITSLGYDHFSH